MTSEINYVPLQDIDNAWKIAFKQLGAGKVNTPLLLLLTIVLFVALLVVSGNVAWLAFIPLAVIMGWRVDKVINGAWAKFGEVNSWPVVAPTAENVPTIFRGVGHTHKPSQVVIADFDNHKLNLLRYSYSEGQGKNKHTYSFVIAHIKLQRQFPRLVLDSLVNNVRLSIYGEGLNKLSLEGDFDKYFRLFIQKGAQVDALSVITPDVMQTLISSNQQQDIEIDGDNLYFIVNESSGRVEAFKALLKSVDAFGDEIVHRARTIRYSKALS